MTLGDIKKGDRARILDVNAEDHTSQRLMAMGIMPSQLVEVVQHAPMGDPIMVTVNCNCLSLRRLDASSVHVELL